MRRLEAIFLDWHNTSMCDHTGVRRDKNIGGWKQASRYASEVCGFKRYVGLVHVASCNGAYLLLSPSCVGTLLLLKACITLIRSISVPGSKFRWLLFHPGRKALVT